ncbi:MAG: aspartyl protease family protein [Myxococcales bacterium]|nr:aspartyl protease family protein [Myxococcales bacterium]
MLLPLLFACRHTDEIPRLGLVDGRWQRVGGLRARSRGWQEVRFHYDTPALPDIGWIDAERRTGSSDHVAVSVHLSSGPDDLRFVVDTGAEHTSITKAAWSRLGLPDGAWYALDADVRGFCGGQPARMSSFDRMTLGPMEVTPTWPMYVLDVPFVLDGLLGAPAWAKGVFAIDVTGRRVRFSVPDDVVEPWRPEWIPLEPDESTPTAMATMQGRSVRAQIDTGAEGSSVSRELAASLGLALGDAASSSGVGGKCTAPSVACPAAIDIGPARLTPAVCKAHRPSTANSPEVNVGLDALKEHVLLLDRERHRMALVPRARVDVAPPVSPDPT